MVARFTNESPLVSAEWLKSHIGAPDVRVLDCTWYLPTETRTGRETYLQHHIPGSQFFDIEDVADTDSTLPHMLPSPEKFASRARKLGLGDGHRIICYDQNTYMASARAWWMFRAMGHGDVAVLDGGFQAWKEVGGAIEDLPPVGAADRHFTARPRADLLRNLDQVKTAIDKNTHQIVDARSAARFKGEAPEPRPNLKSGHMPGAKSVPFSAMVDARGHFLPEDQLAALFAKAGVDLKRPIITTCGSGVTAPVVALGLAIAGNDGAAVYDASWCEWGAEAANLPVETGLPVQTG